MSKKLTEEDIRRIVKEAVEEALGGVIIVEYPRVWPNPAPYPGIPYRIYQGPTC